MLQKLAELEIQVSQSEIGGAKRPAHCDGSHGQMPVILSNRNSRSTKQTMDLGSRSCVDSASHYQDVDSSAPFVVVLVRGDASMVGLWLIGAGRWYMLTDFLAARGRCESWRKWWRASRQAHNQPFDRISVRTRYFRRSMATDSQILCKHE